MSHSKRNQLYAKYCDFCSDLCTSPEGMTSNYILVTNVWNEAERIPIAFRNVSRQTKRPAAWLWMEDGSTDSTYDTIIEQAGAHPDLNVIVERMPTKAQANFFTLGKTHEKVLRRVRERIDAMGIDYMAILDVDSEPCSNYFKRSCWILDNNPNLGAISGYIIGEWKESLVAQPMNSGKMIRWSIVREIQQFWDFCPDTFYNIKALAQGYDVDVLHFPVHQVRPSTNITPRGALRMGRVAYYGGRPFWAVLLRALRRALLGLHGGDMLRGYFSEWTRGTWRCDDPDVLEFFGSGRNPVGLAVEMIKQLLDERGKRTQIVQDS
ncbi:MAG: glycosyltransferase family A protein [Promethearchaeota archaeon]